MLQPAQKYINVSKQHTAATTFSRKSLLPTIRMDSVRCGRERGLDPPYDFLLSFHIISYRAVLCVF